MRADSRFLISSLASALVSRAGPRIEVARRRSLSDASLCCSRRLEALS